MDVLTFSRLQFGDTAAFHILWPLLSIGLSAAVLLRIMEFERKGGPSDADWAEAAAFGDVLACRGDVLQFGSKKKGEAADLFNRTARALAVLAFCPGGVRTFGEHWVGHAARVEEGAPTTRDPVEAFLERLRSTR